MSRPSHRHLAFAGALLSLLVAACSGSSSGVLPTGPARSSGAVPSASIGLTVRSAAATSSPADSGSPEPQDTGGTSVSGDVPDNAVFLRYEDATRGLSIQYVEGWQVQPQPGSVVIRDKDSSETVQLIPGQTDPNGYLATTDLPALQAHPGFTLETQDMVAVKGHGKLLHLRYHAPAAPDPVTGKEVPSTIDRYYVPGTGKLAVITLSTPDGVDNVDAFRQLIESFQWK